MTNSNFVVEHDGRRHFVRIGDDIPVHGVMRFNELAASRAAHLAGVSPEVLHHERGAIVFRHVEGRTLEPADIRDRATRARVVDLIRRAHQQIVEHIRGPVLAFWVFHVVRGYAHTLDAGRSPRAGMLPELIGAARTLEAAVGPVSLVFGHNDLLASNLIDDGRRLWLIDWDYAGFNSPLFDLGGLASNSELDADDEDEMLSSYFRAEVTDDLRHRYEAMRCASLLRETMWGMVSELHPPVDHDYAAYTESTLARFRSAWTDFERVRS